MNTLQKLFLFPEGLLDLRVYAAGGLADFIDRWQRQMKGSPAEVVKSMTATCCRWVPIDGEGGEATQIGAQIGDMLVVRQTLPGHREVVGVQAAVSNCLKASESE